MRRVHPIMSLRGSVSEKTYLERILMGVLIVIDALWLTISDFHHIIHLYPDSVGYLYLRDTHLQSPTHLEQAFGIRPLASQLFFALVGRSSLMVFSLSTTSLICWAFAGYQVSRWIGGRYREGFVFVLFATTPISANIAGWNTTVLSESLAFSALGLSLGLGVGVLRSPRLPWILTYLGSLVLMVTIRYAYLDLVWAMALGILPHLIVQRGAMRAMALEALSFATFVVLGLAFAHLGGQLHLKPPHSLYYAPFNDDVGVRILTSRSATAYFVAHGMPLTTTLKDCKGRNLCNGGILFWSWAKAHLPQTYLSWLVVGTPHHVSEFFHALGQFLNGPIQAYNYSGLPSGPKLLTRMSLDLPFGDGEYFLPSAAGAMVAFGVGGYHLLRHRKRAPQVALWCSWAFPFALVLGGVISTYLSYFADTQELWRHCIEGITITELGAAMALCVVVRDLFVHPTMVEIAPPIKDQATTKSSGSQEP